MNICLLCRNFHKDRGGIETFTRDFALALVLQGHAVHIIAQDIGEYNRRILNPLIHVHHAAFKVKPFLGYWRLDHFFPIEDLHYSKAVAAKVREVSQIHHLDIVETMDYFRQGYWLARQKNLPLFFRLHGWIFNRSHGRIDPFPTLSLRELISWKMQKDTLAASDGIAAVSADTADFAKKIWNLHNKNVKVIHNGIDSQHFYPGETIRHQSVLFSGRLTRNKGIHTLAEAIPLVLNQCPQTTFIIAGKETTVQKDQSVIEMMKATVPADNFVCLGEISKQELISYYQKSSIFVLPSIYESFGLVALEAMASGCAVVASNVGGLKEIIENEKDGLLVPPADPVALAEAVIRLLKNPAFRKELSVQAMAKVNQKFTLERVVRESIEAYEEAIASFRNERPRQVLRGDIASA